MVKIANPVSEIAGAIKAGFQLLASYKKDRHVRRLRLAIDNAETYILEDQKDDPSEKIKSKCYTKFFKYNQG